jgi:hypothetical protein
MIIAFFPGGGGNRFFLMTQGQHNFASGKSYDNQLNSQKFEYRYLDSESNLPDRRVILTHCMNVPLLKQLFPSHENIVVIKSNLNQSLKREWQINGCHRQDRSENPVEDALASISFHDKYYKQYPLDTTGASQVVDVEHEQSAFAVMMRSELENTHSSEFDEAIHVYATMPKPDISEIPNNQVVDGYKSKFLYDAESMKQQFDDMDNQALCLAKWKQVSLHLTNGHNNSCYHPPLHKIPVDSIKHNVSALHNTDYKKEQRRLMLNGERPKECSYCWAMEDQGKLSDRHYRSAEPWAAKDFGKILSSNYTDDATPSYVEVNFNHVCNLRCSYCSPQFSSSWADEINRDGAYPTATPHNAPEHFAGSRRVIPVREHNPYVEAFWKWWPDLYPELTHFRMTGGEPLLDKNTYRVFDYVLDNPNPNLHLCVTSNFSVDEKSWQRYLGYVKQLCQEGQLEHFMQYVSLDAWGTQAEYIRHGLDFELLWDRVNQYLNEVPSYNSLTFIITMNNLSVTTLPELFAGILGLRKTYSHTYQRVWFDTPVLREPAWQSLQILPESYAEKLEWLWAWMVRQLEKPEAPFKGFKDYELHRLDRDIAWMRAGQGEDHSQAQADFYRFFNEHDRRRGTDFLKTFPEMQTWWEECAYYARTT